MTTMPSPGYASIKNLVDFALALVLFVPALPLMLLAMAAVKLTSRGPALYTQERLGRRGRPYTIYKIRTMAHNCERISGPQWSQANDPRVTPLGQFLRRSHLDELPQLWNVLRGEMSLVGPRPERPVFVVQLERAIPEYHDRLLVRPGVTGLAQIQLPPDVDLAGVRRKVACDLCYINQMGPWLDAKILLGTALKVLGISFGEIGRVLRLPRAESADEIDFRMMPGSEARRDSRDEAAYASSTSEPERSPRLRTT